MKRSFLVALFVSLLYLPMGCRLISANPKTAFLGDSITEGWSYPQANYGVFGNTTAQMLARFSSEIPGHHYKYVAILGGTNDTLLGIPPSVTIGNLEKLGDNVIAAKATPILCEIPPIFHSFNKDDHTDYSGAVHRLNSQIRDLASRRHWKLVDYYDAIRDHRSYSSDGVHMKRRGYVVMEWTFLHDTGEF